MKCQEQGWDKKEEMEGGRRKLLMVSFIIFNVHIMRGRPMLG